MQQPVVCNCQCHHSLSVKTHLTFWSTGKKKIKRDNPGPSGKWPLKCCVCVSSTFQWPSDSALVTVSHTINQHICLFASFFNISPNFYSTTKCYCHVHQKRQNFNRPWYMYKVFHTVNCTIHVQQTRELWNCMALYVLSCSRPRWDPNIDAPLECFQRWKTWLTSGSKFQQQFSATMTAMTITPAFVSLTVYAVCYTHTPSFIVNLHSKIYHLIWVMLRSKQIITEHIYSQEAEYIIYILFNISLSNNKE